MKRKPWRVYVFFVVLCELVGILSGLLSRGGIEAFETLKKSPLNPPAIVFPIVWTVLYALMGISTARIYLKDDDEKRANALTLFVLQLIFNFFWGIFFFGMQAYLFALIWLILLFVLIFLMILAYARVDRIAALWQIPYLLWVGFAGYLNAVIVQLNC